jgi:predicted nucleotide-binding protein (sugar kinase/HSP70/actin superfamily)
MQEPYHTVQKAYRTMQEPYRTVQKAYRTVQEPYRTMQKAHHTMQKAYRTVQSMQDNFMQTLPPKAYHTVQIITRPLFSDQTITITLH